jgi:hypothetical protein
MFEVKYYLSNFESRWWSHSEWFDDYKEAKAAARNWGDAEVV